MTYAVVEIAGKQYLVRPRQKIKVDKLKAPEKGSEFKFNKVFLYADESKIEIGQPHVRGAEVQAELLGSKKSKKVIVFHYKAKTRRRTKKGHRQPYSELLIKDIKLSK